MKINLEEWSISFQDESAKISELYLMFTQCSNCFAEFSDMICFLRHHDVALQTVF